MFAISGDSRDIDEDTAKELEHTHFQNSMDKELNELNRQLEQKEVLSLKFFLFSFLWLGRIILFNQFENQFRGDINIILSSTF